MFTGIIEEIGQVKSILRSSNSIRLTITAKTILEDLKIGDSIATNGVCLTVTTFDAHSYTADLMPETVLKTNFKDLKINDRVNLERALPANGRFGGHIVSGHIDGIGHIIKKSKDDKAIRIRIATKPEILHLIVDKGSIAIDGISLTVTDVNLEDFGVSIIEHTQEETALTRKQIGDTVNLENDIIGKYVQRLMQPSSPKKGDDLLDYLRDNGF